jgi:hypothetical protein
MMSGATVSPAWEVSRRAITTDASGSLRIDTQAAAIKAATAGVSENPGRSAARSPATVPRNRAGNVGPPRKLPREILHASPLAVDHGQAGAHGTGGSKVEMPARSAKVAKVCLGS